MQMAQFNKKMFYSSFPHESTTVKRKSSDLALAQRDGIHFFGELHNICKFVEVRRRISARGQDKDEGNGGGRVFEDHRQVGCLYKDGEKQPSILLQYTPWRKTMGLFYIEINATVTDLRITEGLQNSEYLRLYEALP